MRKKENAFNYMRVHNDTIYNAIKNGTPLPKGHERKFEEIVVEYPPAELCTYPEYRGKPYFSIKYQENGEHIIGFGTYKPEVLSRYLREYFIVPIVIEADKVESESKRCMELAKSYTQGLRAGLAECKQESVLDKIRADIEALPKTYPFVNHIDTYVKDDDVMKIIDKYKEESEDKDE